MTVLRPLLTPLEAELVRLFVLWRGDLTVDMLLQDVESMEITAGGADWDYSREARPTSVSSEPLEYFETYFGSSLAVELGLPTCVRIAVAGSRLVEIEITTTTEPIDHLNDKIVIEGYEQV